MRTQPTFAPRTDLSIKSRGLSDDGRGESFYQSPIGGHGKLEKCLAQTAIPIRHFLPATEKTATTNPTDELFLPAARLIAAKEMPDEADEALLQNCLMTMHRMKLSAQGNCHKLMLCLRTDPAGKVLLDSCIAVRQKLRSQKQAGITT